MSYGRPENNHIHHNMKYSRNQYHYAVRRAKNNEAVIKKDKLLNHCLTNNTNCIFKELKNQRRSKDRPNNIDGITGDHNIANKFMENYESLYNVHDDKNEVNEISSYISENLQNSDRDEVYNITPALIKSVILKMKSGKNDVDFDFRSDAFKHGADMLSHHISKIFHGHITQFLLKCSLVPISKDPSASLTSSSNCRAIAMSSPC